MSTFYPGPVGDHRQRFAELLQKCPPGPVIEFGCAEGGSTVQLAEYPRLVYACCTFEGIPKEEFKETLDHDTPGKFKPTCNIQERYELHPNIIPIKGRFIDTLRVLDFQRFAFAYIDCDLYESYKQVLEFLPTRILPGGLFMCDDYHSCRGAQHAVDEWLRTAEGEQWEFTRGAQLFTRKPKTALPQGVPITNSKATTHIFPQQRVGINI